MGTGRLDSALERWSPPRYATLFFTFAVPVILYLPALSEKLIHFVESLGFRLPTEYAVTLLSQAAPGGVGASPVSEQRMNIGLIQNRPMLNAIAESLGHDARVIGKFFAGVAIKPPATFLQGLRQVPMIEAKPWC